MVAVDCASCEGCAYERDRAGCREAPPCRIEDGTRSIIWVPAADAPRAPKPVRLTDEQILAALPDCHGSSLGRSWLLSAARDIERAVLRANNLETPE